MISVIIPFFSNITWLNEALESVYNQTYKNFEIILVNDGSSIYDNEILDYHRNFIKYYKTINQGPGNARNFGISKAKGKYVAFLDSDDLWLPNKLEKQFSFMESTNYAWSHTGYSLFEDVTNKNLSNVLVDKFNGNVFLRSLVSSPIATPCVMIRRDILIENQSLRFSENMRYGQDGYFWLLLSVKYELGVVPEILTKVRIRGTNAALMARVYLQVKSQLWDAIKNQEDFKIIIKKIPSLITLSYRINQYNFRLILFLESKFKCNFKVIEVLSKIFYLPTYLLLKVQKFIYNYNVQK